jgi:hypothetical protein
MQPENETRKKFITQSSTMNLLARSGPRTTITALGVWVLMLMLPVGDAFAAPPTLSVTGTRVGQNGIKIAWTVTGGDSTNLLYVYSENGTEDVGFRAQSCNGSTTSCSTTLNVPNGGVFRYVVSVKNNAGQFTNRAVEVTVPGLTPPSVSSALVNLDMFNVAEQTLSWSRSGAGFVNVYGPTGFNPVAPRRPPTGSMTIPVSQLPIGRNTWSIEYCERSGDSEICSSDRTQVTYVVGPSRFTGDNRKFTPAGRALALSWNVVGNGWFVSAPSLGIGTWVSQPSFTIPATAAQGAHNVSLVSCDFQSTPNRCSNRVDLNASVAGVVRFTVAEGAAVEAADQVGSLTPTGGGSAITLSAARAGTFHLNVASGSTVTAGTLLAFVITADEDNIQVVVGETASLVTWTNRAWSTDFTALTFDTQARPSTGSPLDVTFDSQGALWGLGEFSSGISRVSSNTLSHFEVPLARVSSSFTRTTPFASPFGTAENPRPPVSTTTLGERVTKAGNAVWFTQGGKLFHTGSNNHTRLIRFALDGVDLPSTPFDDRLCAVHVPGDNNEVIGAAWDGKKVWFTAWNNRTSGSRAPSLLWFPDDGTAAAVNGPNFPGCDNLLDYSDDAAVDAATAGNRCTPTNTACVHEVLVPAKGGAPAHVTVDPADGSIWYVDFTGFVLGRYVLSTDKFTCFAMPASSYVGFFGGFPWQLRVDGDSVFIGEYGDKDLVRFNKNAAGASSDCTQTPSATPAMSQLHLPVVSRDVALHSIEIQGGRLWFTLANESGGPLNANASSFGFVDLASWRAGAPTGVMYNGLTTLGRSGGSHRHSFRGIAVSPSGKVGLADMRYTELDLLTPR